MKIRYREKKLTDVTMSFSNSQLILTANILPIKSMEDGARKFKALTSSITHYIIDCKDIKFDSSVPELFYGIKYIQWIVFSPALSSEAGVGCDKVYGYNPLALSALSVASLVYGNIAYDTATPYIYLRFTVNIN